MNCIHLTHDRELEPLGSKEGKSLFDYLTDYQLEKMDCPSHTQ